jgi:CHAD domain-containing protein
MIGGPELAATSAASGAVGPFLEAKLRRLDDRLAQVGPRVTAPDHEAEAVHDLRVAMRRIRTLLEAGAPVLGRYHAGVVRRALRDLLRASGELRDEEVLLGLLTSLGEDRPDVERWIAGRRRRERALRGALRRKLASGELDRCRGLLEALLAFPVKPSRDKRLAKFARRAVDDARRDVERRKAAPLGDVGATHRLRIAFKRLRYTAEAFAEALPPELSSVAHAAARMQTRLGELHDADVALACVRRARSLSPAGKEALVAALTRLRAERASGCEQELGAPSGTVLSVRGARHRPGAAQAVGAVSLRKISTR